MTRRSIDQRLEDSTLKLRLALRAAQIGIWEWIVETGEMNYSPRARAICGFSPEVSVTLDMVRAVTHPDDLPRTSALAVRALDPEVRAKEVYEYRVVRADTGETRWVLAHGEAIFDSVDGVTKPLRYLGTIEDITDRKLNEIALRESALKHRLAIEAARMAVWELELRTETLSTTPELNQMFGLAHDAKPTIEDLRALYAPGERERLLEAGRQALANGVPHFEAEFRCRRPNGDLHWLLLRAEVLFGSAGEMVRVIGVLMDIDARKRSEERQSILLRELNHRVKNSLSVVQAIATQTFRGGRADPAALDDFRSRLGALAKANDVLMEEDFSAFSLLSLIDRVVAPYRIPESRVRLAGEDVSLPPRLNSPLALVLHELCTNAAKYGGLSTPNGYVTISWRILDGQAEVLWREHGGPAPPEQFSKGFGTRLITEILGAEIGSVTLHREPDGFRCKIMARLR